MDEGATNSKPIHIWKTGKLESSKDILANEKPLELSINVDGEAKVLGMLLRTPGEDDDLSLGWLLGEAIIHSIEPVLSITIGENQVNVELDASKINNKRVTS